MAVCRPMHQACATLVSGPANGAGVDALERAFGMPFAGSYRGPFTTALHYPLNEHTRSDSIKEIAKVLRVVR